MAGNNTELYELTGRAAALRDFLNIRRRYDRYGETIKPGEGKNPLFHAAEIEAIMGWADGCRKIGHPANEPEAEPEAGFHGPYEK